MFAVLDEVVGSHSLDLFLQLNIQTIHLMKLFTVFTFGIISSSLLLTNPQEKKPGVMENLEGKRFLYPNSE